MHAENACRNANKMRERLNDFIVSSYYLARCHTFSRETDLENEDRKLGTLCLGDKRPGTYYYCKPYYKFMK
jgi:hypothetical protein